MLGLMRVSGRSGYWMLAVHCHMAMTLSHTHHIYSETGFNQDITGACWV